MEPRLIALKLFKTTSSAAGLGESAEIDYQEIIVGILLKFIEVLEGAVIIIAGIFAVKLLKRYFARIEITHERQRTAINLLEKITNGFVIVVAITLGLKVIGLDLTLLISVLTLGLSFGMRDVIKNYVAGLLILFKSPFEIGDVVKIRSHTGRIERIEFQAVTLRTFDRREITIHNSDLLTQPITNFSKSQFARYELVVTLGYGSDVKRALTLFERVLNNHEKVLKSPPYSIIVKKFTDTGIDVMLRFWVQKPCNILKLRTEIAVATAEAFDENALIAPFAREAGLDGMYGMTDARKERLRVFYGQPFLAELAGQTVVQVAAAVAGNAAENGDVNGEPVLQTAPAVIGAPTELSDEMEEPE